MEIIIIGLGIIIFAELSSRIIGNLLKILSILTVGILILIIIGCIVDIETTGKITDIIIYMVIGVMDFIHSIIGQPQA